MERINRAIELIRELESLTAPPRWTSRFVANGNYEPWQGSPCTEDHGPYWMNVAAVAEDAARHRPEPVELPKKDLQLRLEIKGEHSKEVNSHLGELSATREVALPLTPRPLLADPRIYGDERRWRDAIRLQLEIQSIGLQLAYIEGTVETDDGKTRIYLYGYSGDWVMTWNRFRELVGYCDGKIAIIAIPQVFDNEDEDKQFFDSDRLNRDYFNMRAEF